MLFSIKMTSTGKNKSEFLKEISELLGMDYDKLVLEDRLLEKRYPNRFSKYSILSDEEFKQKVEVESDTDSLNKFYRETNNYIFELMEISDTEGRIRLRDTFVKYAISNGYKRHLDYGCGVGCTNICAARNNLATTAADLPGKTFEFLKKRLISKGVPVTVLEIDSPSPLVEDYDIITCFEVIMQVPNPLEVLGHLAAHIKKGGALLLTYRFRNNYSLALKENLKYERDVEKRLMSCNMLMERKLHLWGPENDDGKYLFIYKKLS